MICVLCGKNDAVYRGMCESCAPENIKITFPSKVEYKVCPKCSALKLGKKWIYNDTGNALNRYVESMIGLPDHTFEIRNSVLNKLNDQESLIEVDIAQEEGLLITKASRVFLRPSPESCPTCDRRSGSYYEAILQIRFEDKTNTDFLNDIVQLISSVPDRSDPNQFISSFQKKNEGLDVFLGSRKLGEKMIKYLYSKYPGKSVRSKKIAGRNDGKNMYRFTFLYRIFNPRPGSIIRYDKRNLCTKRTEGESIIFSFGLSNSTLTVSYQDMNRNGYKFLKREPELVKGIIITGESGESMLMNLQNYSTSAAEDNLSAGEVVVSKYEDSYFLVS